MTYCPRCRQPTHEERRGGETWTVHATGSPNCASEVVGCREATRLHILRDGTECADSRHASHQKQTRQLSGENDAHTRVPSDTWDSWDVTPSNPVITPKSRGTLGGTPTQIGPTTAVSDAPEGDDLTDSYFDV